MTHARVGVWSAKTILFRMQQQWVDRWDRGGVPSGREPGTGAPGSGPKLWDTAKWWADQGAAGRSRDFKVDGSVLPWTPTEQTKNSVYPPLTGSKAEAFVAKLWGAGDIKLWSLFTQWDLLPECTTSAPRVHSICSPSAQNMLPECTTSAPRVHNICSTSAQNMLPECTKSGPRVH